MCHFCQQCGRRWIYPEQQLQHSDAELQFPLHYRRQAEFLFQGDFKLAGSRVPTRLTQAQFNADERQAGAQTPCTPGTYNPTARMRTIVGAVDRRTIVGGMYERQLNANTVLTIEADYDVKDINQYFSQITENVNPNYKSYADLRHDGRLGEMPLKSYVGFFLNNMEQEGDTFQNLAPDLEPEERFFRTIGEKSITSAAAFVRNWNSLQNGFWPSALGLSNRSSACRPRIIFRMV